jgi:putative permease
MREIFKRNSVKVFLLICLILFLLWIALQVENVFLILFFSGLLTQVLSPIVDFLEAKGVKRLYGILMIYFIIMVAIVVFLVIYMPPLLGQIASIEASISSPEFGKHLQSIESNLQAKFPFVDFRSVSERVNLIFVDAASKWFSILTSAGSILMMFVIVPFVAFFFLKDGDVMVRKLIEFVPNRYFEMTLNIVYKIEIQLGRYIRAWLIEAAVIGVLSVVGLLIIGVKYAIIIGILAGIANLIPYLGPIVGAVPAIIVTIIQNGNFRMVLPIISMFVVIRLIDDLAVVPSVYSRGIEIHPLAVVLLILIAAEVGGILGMVLAMPLYTVLRVVAKETYWGLESYKITKAPSAAVFKSK